MITLIAESKTMSAHQTQISSETLDSHSPIYQQEADRIVEKLLSLPILTIREIVKVSLSMAIKIEALLNDYFNHKMGLKTSDAFTGEVFKSLDYKSLSVDSRDYSQNHLIIVSSLYGLLKPYDIIKPYRFDYNVKFPDTPDTVAQRWKEPLTIGVIKMIKERNVKSIINLLSSDAGKCLEWKTIKDFTNVVTPKFKIIDQNGCLKTPHAKTLKMLRGKLTRAILENKFQTEDDLYTWRTADLALDVDQSKNGLPTFIYFPE